MPEHEAKSRLLVIKQRIEKGADFSKQAKLYSEDGSAAKGGDLGWISPGDTVPEFEAAMNQLDVGQMSGVVQYSSASDSGIGSPQHRCKCETEKAAGANGDTCQQIRRCISGLAAPVTRRGYHRVSPRTRALMAQAALLAVAAGEPAGIGPDLCLQLAQHGQTLVVLANKHLLQQRAALRLNVQWHDYDPQQISPLPSGHLRVLHVPTAQPVQAGQLNPANSPYVLNLLIRAMQGCQSGEFASAWSPCLYTKASLTMPAFLSLDTLNF